jgi:hypothetical protein
MEQIEKLKDLDKIQKEFLNLDISYDNNNMLIDEDENDKTINNNIGIESDIDFPEYINQTKKRKKKSKSKKNNLNIYNIRNVNKDENIYEVEKILNHKIENKKYIFYVKWKNYGDIDNSWVKEQDFNQKDIIMEYFHCCVSLLPASFTTSSL